MIEDELKTIESLAKECDDDLGLELNRRLQEILDWVKDVLDTEPNREA